MFPINAQSTTAIYVPLVPIYGWFKWDVSNEYLQESSINLSFHRRVMVLIKSTTLRHVFPKPFLEFISFAWLPQQHKMQTQYQRPFGESEHTLYWRYFQANKHNWSIEFSPLLQNRSCVCKFKRSIPGSIFWIFFQLLYSLYIPGDTLI